MKTLIFILLSTSLLAQSGFRLKKTEDFNFQVVIDPHASINENGLNIGAGIEYSGTIYTRASITSFTALKGGYFDAVGAIGLNFTSGYFENMRYYLGGRLGVIKRERNTYPTAGFEIGLNVNLNESMFVGLRATSDKRSDFEFYGENAEMRKSGYIVVGFKF